MLRDVSSCNTYNYGDALYWDSRYVREVGPFDWYQRYSSLRPFVRKFLPLSSRVLMVGCGNAVMSEDMVKDGYEDIMNIDISAVAIDMMKRKYADVPQLKYMQMDVRDMGFFKDESFDSVIDKGTLDSLMCGTNAPISASQMLEEVSRLLKPEGIYMLITYGDPRDLTTGRIVGCEWEERGLSIIEDLQTLKVVVAATTTARPGFQRPEGSSSPLKSLMEPVPILENGVLPLGFVLEDPDSHYIYVCQKTHELIELSTMTT